ncbi:hypothetical protein Tco_1479653 [Tanacetum coccineum]
MVTSKLPSLIGIRSILKVPGLTTYFVTSLTSDGTRSCVMQSASFTQRMESNIPTVFSWGSSISSDSLLPSILLWLVIIVVVVGVGVTVVVIVACALLPDPLASRLCKWLPLKFEALRR